MGKQEELEEGRYEQKQEEQLEDERQEGGAKEQRRGRRQAERKGEEEHETGEDSKTRGEKEARRAYVWKGWLGDAVHVKVVVFFFNVASVFEGKVFHATLAHFTKVRRFEISDTFSLSVHSCKHGPKKKWQGSSLATTVARKGLVLLVTIHLALVPFLLATTLSWTRFAC